MVARETGRTSRRPVRAGRNAPLSEKVQVSFWRAVFNRSFLISMGIALLILLIIGSSLLWYYKVYANPERVFWGMIDNNLASKSVTKVTGKQDPSGQNIEYTQLSWNPDPRLRTIRQLSSSTTAPPTRLTLESISTPSNDYQRYVLIDRPGKKKDYSHIYEMWLQNSGQNGNSPTFNNAFFGAVLFGNLSQADRQDLNSLLKKTYKVDFSRYEQSSDNGRRLYIYQADIDLRSYASAAKLYAQKLGLPSANLINPNNYRPGSTLKVTFTVDVLSRQLVKISYGQVSETYEGYGLVTDIAVPKKIVSSQDFQKAIEEATK